MGKDPAFLFYDGDAARDVSHMNRLERGCYFDIMQAQKKFGPLTLPAIKKILGRDFDECWPSLQMCLTYVQDMYFISWLKDSIEKRQKYSEGRAKNRKGLKSTKNNENNSTYVPHMVNVDANEIENKNNKESEKDFTQPDVQGDEIFFPIDTPPMRELWAAWKAARWKNFGMTYGMYGEQAALKQLEDLDFHQAKKAIQQAIASNWKNLYPDKNGQRKNGNDQKSRIDEIIENRFGSG